MISRKNRDLKKISDMQGIFQTISKPIAYIALAKMWRKTLGCRIFAINAISKLTTIQSKKINQLEKKLCIQQRGRWIR